MLRKAFILFISLISFQMPMLAHASWRLHADDMYEVFGFERNEELTKWMKFVSSALIDNNNSEHHFELSNNLNLRRSFIDEFNSSLVSEVILTFFKLDKISVKSIC